MKKYIIYAPHKCGSTILAKILKSIFDLPRFNMAEDIVVNNDSGLMKLRFDRPTDPIKHIMGDFANDNYIFMSRNPVAITISMFYSYGYTHGYPSHITKEQYDQRRRLIQNQGLHEFVKDRLNMMANRIEHCFAIPITNKMILPYELMVSNFKSFLMELLQALDMMSAYNTTLTRWEKEFSPIEDKSDLIVAGKIKPHKRTTDIYEWKKKLDEDFLVSLLKEYPFVSEYDKHLKEWL